jgi:hypothetical protein
MTLLEVMAAIGLLSTFFLVAMALIAASVRVPAEGSAAHSAGARLDAAVARLRADAWSAEKFSPAAKADGEGGKSAAAVTVSAAAGRTVKWVVDPDGTWVRTASTPGKADEVQSWPGLAADVTFNTDGPTLVVDFSQTSPDSGGRLQLVSQVLLSGNGGEDGEDGAGGKAE